MDQFKVLPPEARFRFAWHWLTGYLEAEYERKTARAFAHERLRQLLDRMHALVDAPVPQPVASKAKPVLQLVAPASHDYQFSWLVLIGYLEAAYHYGSGQLSRGQLKHVLDKMALASDTPPPPAPGPETWEPVTWDVMLKMLREGAEVVKFTKAQTGRMLKQVLTNRWPEGDWKVASSRYNSTSVYYTWHPTIDYNEVRKLAQHFAGTEADNCDGQTDLYHIKPTAGGPQLVKHGTGYVFVNPTDRIGHDVNPLTGKRLPTTGNH